jgi:spermidine synthase
MFVKYNEDNIDEFGVVHLWNDTVINDFIVTKRGTDVEFIRRPKWGLACYMDNSIQSCEIDEELYHESLVHPAMASCNTHKRVMIIGGGEGATAREVLKWSDVEHVDMFEWDEEVVQIFKTKYTQWAKGAWNDTRLKLHFVDIFEEIKTTPLEKYDVIIIDLFDPSEENLGKWQILLKSLHNWITKEGSIVIYSGMRNILEKKNQPYKQLINAIETTEYWRGIEIQEVNIDKQIIPYKVFIPSFSGESTFLLLKNKDSLMDFTTCNSLKSHLSNEVWNSYKTLNW